MPNSARINEDDGLLGRFEIPENVVDHEVFLLRIVGGKAKVERLPEPGTFNLLGNIVGRQGQIDRSTLDVTLLDGIIDELSCCCWIVQSSDIA